MQKITLGVPSQNNPATAGFIYPITFAKLSLYLFFYNNLVNSSIVMPDCSMMRRIVLGIKSLV